MKNVRCAFVSAMTLLLAGCVASMQYNYTPQAVKLPAAGASGGQALVLGQAYMRGYGDWVNLLVSYVDDTRTLSPLVVRPDINFYVPAGKRMLKVRVLIGNSMSWQETDGDPQLAVDLKEGMVYQLHASEGTDIRGHSGVSLSIQRIGTIEQYEIFAREHPGLKGKPLTHL